MNIWLVLTGVSALSGDVEAWLAQPVPMQDTAQEIFVAQADELTVPDGNPVPQAELETVPINAPDVPSVEETARVQRVAIAETSTEPQAAQPHRGLIKRPLWRVKHEAELAKAGPTHDLPRGD